MWTFGQMKLSEVPHVATPAKTVCLQCLEDIQPDDSGVVMPYLAGEMDGGLVAIHEECHLRSVFGSVGHQQRRCSCFGGTEEDPPGLTKREAAKAAAAMALGGRAA